MIGSFPKYKSGGLKYMKFKKDINCYFICMKMKLMKNKKKYLQQEISRKVLVPQTTSVEGQQELCPFYK